MEGLGKHPKCSAAPDMTVHTVSSAAGLDLHATRALSILSAPSLGGHLDCLVLQGLLLLSARPQLAFLPHTLHAPAAGLMGTKTGWLLSPLAPMAAAYAARPISAQV